METDPKKKKWGRGVGSDYEDVPVPKRMEKPGASPNYESLIFLAGGGQGAEVKAIPSRPGHLCTLALSFGQTPWHENEDSWCLLLLVSKGSHTVVSEVCQLASGMVPCPFPPVLCHWLGIVEITVGVFPSQTHPHWCHPPPQALIPVDSETPTGGQMVWIKGSCPQPARWMSHLEMGLSGSLVLRWCQLQLTPWQQRPEPTSLESPGLQTHRNSVR